VEPLARLSGVPEEHLRRLEQGRRRPSRRTVDALAAALRLEHAEHERLCLAAGFATRGAPGWSVPPDGTRLRWRATCVWWLRHHLGLDIGASLEHRLPIAAHLIRPAECPGLDLPRYGRRGHRPGLLE
jgi:transcriptional regulator with XRE-family HTH domain